VKAFHDQLCETRVLDPACGTGNFLYVSMELMKRLEGEVLEALLDLGGQEALRGLGGHTVDPHQFLGLEINPRAAAISELVLWIGYLQWHFRTRGGTPEQPILRQFKNIEVKNAVLTWNGYPLPQAINGKEAYPNPKQPVWPAAEFIVGNPPFLGKGVFMRAAVTLRSNEGLASIGPALGGRGFVLSKSEAEHLSSNMNASWLRRLTTGKDITERHRGRYAIDVGEFETEVALRKAFPRIYQHLKETVFPTRSTNNDPRLRNYWWRFRRSNEVYFGAVENLPRFIATVETTKHRVLFLLINRNCSNMV
jgi:hypothetical protein